MTNLLRMVPPRSRDTIRRDTYLLRKRLELHSVPYFDIIRFLEHVLPQSDPSFSLEVLPDEELIGVQAEYVPKQNAIWVKNSVYDAAVDGHWWARSTLAHELGHYYYHDELSVRYAKLDPGQKIPPDYDPERQANVFAAELLAPIHLIKGMDKHKISREFGVSPTLAFHQLQTLERVEKRQKRKLAQKKKRPSRSLAADR